MTTKLMAVVAVVLMSHLGAAAAEGQYFGRNKVQYRTFDFKVLETEHFSIYYYPEESDAIEWVAPMAERSYARLAKILHHDLRGTQPLILYASQPHFQQTNVVESILGEGTGGVTESLRRRIVMPLAGGFGETAHVLRHELVHAFQYDILGPAAGQPLWFIEGMAEYLAIGSDDVQTAVWLRDAASTEKFPTLDSLDDPKYFPYRFGHAFWAYVGQRWGDEVIGDILTAMAPVRGNQLGSGHDAIFAIERALGLESAAISEQWRQSVLETMLRPLEGRPTRVGRTLISPRTDGEVNVGPSLSPDGSRLAFLSTRSRLSVDLLVADARTGVIERKLAGGAVDPHFDSLQFIESAGAWDPSGRRLAVAALRRGRPQLAVFDVASGDRTRELELGDLDEILEPVWSPEGDRIVIAGLQGGLSDLYVVTLATGDVQRLTDDPYLEIHPAWSPDGLRLVYVTDRYSSDLEALQFGPYQLATLDLRTRRSSHLPAFDGATHLSPQWVSSGIYFVADPDGVPDVYRLKPGEPGLDRLTQSLTGVIGITRATPSLSVARQRQRMAFVLYRDGGYEIHTLDTGEVTPRPAPLTVSQRAARLAPASAEPTSVDRALAAPLADVTAPGVSDSRDYHPGLGLDYAGQSFGVAPTGVGAYFGGGIALRFSDMLGDHVLETVAQINGEFEDIGGGAVYMNRRHRWNFGAAAQQVPYVTGFVASGFGDVNGEPAFLEQLVKDRQVDRLVRGIVEYPLSRANRFEFAAGLRHLSFEREVVTRAFDPITGGFLGEETMNRDLADPVTLGEGSAAFVRDTAIFGATGPILGSRSRFAVEPTLGSLDFTTALGDTRYYTMPVRPLTVAARLLHIGRYGGDAEAPILSPLFLGYQTLVRGYDAGSFGSADCGADPATCEDFDRLLGSRVLVAGLELRAPLVGAFTGKLEYGPVPVDLIAFFDAGVAWTRDTAPRLFGSGDRPWVRSTGVGVRVNAFGYMVMELDAVKPLDRVRDGWRFVFGLTPGF